MSRIRIADLRADAESANSDDDYTLLTPAEVLALIEAVEAAQAVLDAYREPRFGGVVEAVMALNTAVTDRFDFSEGGEA